MERELPVDKLAILTKIQTDASVAQLDRASVFGTEGWGFESLRVYSFSLANSARPGSSLSAWC